MVRSIVSSRSAALLLAAALAGCGNKGSPAEASASSATTPSASAAASAPAPTPSASAPEPSASAAPPPAPRPPFEPEGKLLCFGDSITQADWPGKISPNEKWVAQLGAKSKKITAVNAGKNGRTTSAIDELGKALAQNQDAKMVLFFLGVNDMLHAEVGVVEKATVNLGKMVDLTREKLPSAEIVILAPIDINVDKLSSFFKGAGMGKETEYFMKALSMAYQGLAKKKGTRFINLFRAVSPENIEDGVHANGKGQIQIADAVWRGLVTGMPAPPSSR